MSNKCIIGMDIGGTNFRIGAVDSRGKTENFRKVPVNSVFVTEDVLGDLTAYLKQYISELREPADAVAIGFPATLNRERTVVLQAPNVKFMEQLPVVETLSKKLGLPVFIERDVTMLLYYDAEQYGLEKQGITFGIYFGTGIGSAILINGRPLVGKNGTAGEIGHIPVDGSSEVCGCGNLGCMESLAGGKYLAKLQKEKYPETFIGDMFAEHGAEPEVLLLVERMSETVATVINLLDPEQLLIGGGIPSMKGFPREELNRRILVHTRKPFPAENLEIVYADDREDKGVLGAAIYANTKL